MTKDFALFCGSNYYPEGGASDFVGWFYAVEDAKEVAENRKCDWAHVTDRDMDVITEGNRTAKGRFWWGY